MHLDVTELASPDRKEPQQKHHDDHECDCGPKVQAHTKQEKDEAVGDELRLLVAGDRRVCAVGQTRPQNLPFAVLAVAAAVFRAVHRGCSVSTRHAHSIKTE